jgi:sulfate/thiosulfate transport system ATP-binding protein
MSIVVKDLIKRYGDQTVVDRVSLEIEEGELFVLLGASGSGKSTVLRMIAGLVPVDDGRILLHGEDVTDWSPQARNIGLVFQNYSLFPHMTVAENVEFGLAVRKVDPAERAERRDELLALVGLAGLGRRNVRQLSGGQQQRVAVARALAFSPAVLLLDEPFGALDVRIRSQLRRSLKEIQERLGITSILVTHDQEEAFELADRIGVVERGRLLEIGTPGDLYRRPRHQFVASFIGDANLLGVRRREGGLKLGPIRLPVPADPPDLQPAVGWAVLLRPEDLTLAAPDDDVEGLDLGVGRIEETLALGSVERVRVRMDPVEGTWPITPDFGSPGIPLWIKVSGANGSAKTRVGRTVRLGLKGYHLVPRLTLRILLCVERAEQLPLVAALATDLSTDLRGQLTVVCVAPDESAGQRLAAEAEEAFAQRSTSLDLRVHEGPPIREILREAMSGGYDLLVLPGPGRCARTGLRSLGIVEDVLRETPIPVLVANGKEDVQRILLCTAAGEAGKRDVAFGAQMARATGAKATLLYVDRRARPGEETPGRTPDPPEWVRRHLEHASQVVAAHGVRARTSVRHGEVAREILKEASEGDHDLIVLGGHQPGTWPDRTAPNVVLEIIRDASQNILVVPGPLPGGAV